MTGTSGRHPASGDYWAAYLAATISHAVRMPHDHARRTLNKALGAFRRSPTCTPELLKILDSKEEA